MQLNISTNYKQVINIKKDVAQAVLKQKEEDNGIFIYSNLKRGEVVFFALDNVDPAIGASDGKKQLQYLRTFFIFKKWNVTFFTNSIMYTRTG